MLTLSLTNNPIFLYTVGVLAVICIVLSCIYCIRDFNRLDKDSQDKMN